MGIWAERKQQRIYSQTLQTFDGYYWYIYRWLDHVESLGVYATYRQLSELGQEAVAEEHSAFVTARKRLGVDILSNLTYQAVLNRYHEADLKESNQRELKSNISYAKHRLNRESERKKYEKQLEQLDVYIYMFSQDRVANIQALIHNMENDLRSAQDAAETLDAAIRHYKAEEEENAFLKNLDENFTEQVGSILQDIHRLEE